jgi:hypothetical protein
MISIIQRIYLSIVIVIMCCGLANAQQYQWSKKIGSIAHDVANAVAVDKQGNTFTVGSFEGTIDFDPTQGFELLNPMGNHDAFIVKYNAAGNYQWSKSISGLKTEVATAISINSAGFIAIAGYFSGTVDFNPDTAATYWLTAKGGQDIFTVVLDSTGQFLWAATQGGNGADAALAVFIDDNNSVYNAGYFEGTSDFNPDTNAVFNITSQDDFDGFVTKLQNGTLVWAKTLTNNKDIEIRNIEIAQNKLFISGVTESTTDFNPDAGTYQLTSKGGTDVFIACYDTLMQLQWAQIYGGTLADVCNKMKIYHNCVYATGYFRGSVSFNPDTINVPPVTSAGLTDIFILKLDTAGNFVWATCIGDTLWDESYGIDVDTSGRVITTGSFRGNTDFNPGTGVNKLASPQSAAIYVLVLDSNANYIWSLQAGGTDQERGLSVAVDANCNVNVAGYFNGLVYFDQPLNGLHFAQGYQDAFLAQYAFCQTSTTYDTVTACNSFILQGGNVIYTASGTYTETLKTADGCDSIIVLQLTINNNAVATDSIFACKPITWIDGNIYSSSNNTASFVLSGAADNGCDSVIYLALELQPINVAISFINDTLFTADTIASIQWFICDSTWQAIANATANYFTPSSNGNYAAVFTNGNCVDSSICMPIQLSGVFNYDTPQFSVYPNPASNQGINITLANSNQKATLQVYNNQGLLCAQYNMDNKLHISLMLPDAKGLYAICYNTSFAQSCKYIVKQ